MVAEDVPRLGALGIGETMAIFSYDALQLCFNLGLRLAAIARDGSVLHLRLARPGSECGIWQNHGKRQTGRSDSEISARNTRANTRGSHQPPRAVFPAVRKPTVLATASNPYTPRTTKCTHK
jgi:hypothetical protein